MASKDRGYFQKYSTTLNLWTNYEIGQGLRECQMGAFWAVWSHFSCSHEPALVSLPTGAGKTALMIALSFGLKAHRVLIVTPAEILRDQTAYEFSSLRVFLKMGALPKSIEK